MSNLDRTSPRQAIYRMALAGGLSAVLIVVCSRIPKINDTTAALLMVLLILGISTKWGWAPGLTAAIIAGSGYDYYFLGPPGFSITAPEFGVALIAFLATAVTTGQLAAELNRKRIRAEEGRDELEKLYRLVNAMLQDGSGESTRARLADRVLEIFGAGGVALYDKHSGRINRSGPGATAISDQALQKAATTLGLHLEDPRPGFFVAPIRHGGEIVGSIGVRGGRFSESLAGEVAARVGLGLAKLYATERTTEAEVVRRAEELKSAVLDAMAHEIRSPLNSVKLAATTLRSGCVTELYRDEMLSIIEEEANRMDRSIDEALQLARIEANQVSPKKEPQNLARLIPAVMEEMGAELASRALRVRVPESLPLAECDKALIVRVLKQLLNNALKYSPDGSPLTVSADFIGAAIVIDVVDCGPGVADDERDHIFEKHYRGRAARSRTAGMGLGLAAAKCIVQAHGGEIWVTTPLDGGAAFHISLPVAANCEPVATEWRSSR